MKVSLAWDIAKPRVVVATPMGNESITMEFSQSMLLPLASYVDWCQKDFKASRGVPVGIARDQLVNMFLEDKSATHILWVDCDSICESPKNPNEALRILLQMNSPIVSGIYRAKKRDGFPYAMWQNANLPDGQLGFVPIQNWTGNWFEVDAIGIGFCLCKREVFEKIPAPWFPWNSPAPSEDFSFCLKAKKFGYHIMIFSDVKVSHIGVLKVKTDGTISVLEM